MKILFPALVLAMAACAGPSKARYVVLLHECREQNREHVRMLKEYEKQDTAKRPGVEQAHGAAEFGLGGW